MNAREGTSEYRQPQLVDMWDEIMAYKVLKVRCICLHALAFRIGYEGEGKPVILWIGVVPGTLTDKDGVPLQTVGNVAVACKQLLESHDCLQCRLRAQRCLKTIDMRASRWSHRTGI